MNIELLGVSKVKSLIAKSDYLVPNISENDREPSWDGDIEVYNKPGNTHRKEDLIIRVPVQVKGHCQERHPKKISFSVETSDLKNYLQAGGTLFFVVYVDKDGERKSVYYKELLPYNLKRICKDLEGQETKTIHLKRFPTDKKAISNILLNFASDMQKQRAAITTDIISIDDIMSDGKSHELSLSFTDINARHDNPFDYLFNNRVYLYATLEHGIKVPVNCFENITTASTEISLPVKVGETVFYDKYAVVHDIEGLCFKIGKSITVKPDAVKNITTITFKQEGTITERIRDYEFIISAIKNNGFSLNDVPFDLSEASEDERAFFLSDDKIEYLKLLKQTKELLSKLHVHTELDISSIDQKSDNDLQLLIDSVINGNEVPLVDTSSSTGTITIGNLRLIVCITKGSENGKFLLKDFYSKAFIAKAVLNDGTELNIPMGIALKKDALLSIDNVDFDATIEELNCFEKTPELVGIVINFFLETLLAFDESTTNEKKSFLINGATLLIDWLIANDKSTPFEVLLLNKFQIYKRLRDFTDEEIDELNKIIEKKDQREDIITGAYLLLGNQVSAERHFARIEPEMQKNFKKYPIFKFWCSPKE